MITVTTEFLNRVVACDHLDLTVGGVVGCGPPFLLHVIALNESKEVVLAEVTIPVDDDLGEIERLAVLLVYTRCLVHSAEREKRRLALKGISFDENEDVQNRSAIPMPESRAATPPLSRRRRVRP